MTDNKKYGLIDSDLNNVISILLKNQKIDEIILFGSRAKGNFKEGSDIDIALKGATLKLIDIIDVTIEIDSLLLPYKFDLIIFDRINEKALIDHINRIGIVLFSKKNQEE
ncbi:MAG: nucleotidyltransferase domain-containing protein [Bacteroidetes bacterium]|nr:MAG: nucleotidyltransferase domain-containing protein [Bacteroidota bacterium]